MAKPKLTKGEGKAHGGVATDEILRSAKADNIFTLKNFVNRFKYRIGKGQAGKEAVYQRTVKRMVDAFEKGELKQDQIEFPVTAFEVLRHKK